LDANGIENGDDVVLAGFIPSEINIYSAKTDYVHPFRNGLRLEAGLKTSFVKTDNQVNYLRNSGSGWLTDDRSNHFVYQENINSAYAILSRTIKKWELTAGLRIENTNASGTQELNDSSFKRNYTNLFPNAGAVYTISEKNQLSAAYSRRIRRPDYQDLNPFTYFLDSLTYGQGNPYLQPEFSNRFEVAHTYNKFLTTTISYTETNSIITEILKQFTEKKTTYHTKENFSQMRQFGLSVSANRKMVSWWSVNLYAGVFNNNYRGLYNDGSSNTPVDITVTSFSSNLSNSFTFAKTWSAEVSGWFNSNPSEGLIIARSMGAMNIGLSKQLFKKKAALKFGIRDVLRTANFNGYSRYADVDLNVSNDRRKDNRVYNISFSYKFGKNNIAPERRRSGGASEEQSRVRSGG